MTKDIVEGQEPKQPESAREAPAGKPLEISLPTAEEVRRALEGDEELRRFNKLNKHPGIFVSSLQRWRGRRRIVNEPSHPQSETD